MLGMTARQEEVLDFITTEIQRQGYPPTLREIGQRVGIRSTNGVNDHLHALERKGYITREDMKSRCIRLTDKPRPGQPAAPSPTIEARTSASMVEVKVYRRIVAGPDPFLEVNVAELVRVGPSMVAPGRVFALHPAPQRGARAARVRARR